MQLPRPRASIASPFPIWPLLLECRAQRRPYSAAPALAPTPQPAESQPQISQSRSPSPPLGALFNRNAIRDHPCRVVPDLENQQQDVFSQQTRQQDTSPFRVHFHRVGLGRPNAEISTPLQPALQDLEAETIQNGAYFDTSHQTAVVVRPLAHHRQMYRKWAWQRVFVRYGVVGSYRRDRSPQDMIGDIIPSFDSEEGEVLNTDTRRRIQKERGMMRWSDEQERIVISLETSIVFLSDTTLTYLESRRNAATSRGLHDPYEEDQLGSKRQPSRQSTLGRSEHNGHLPSGPTKEQLILESHRYHEDTLPGRLLIMNLPGKYLNFSVTRHLLLKKFGLPMPIHIIRLKEPPKPVLLVFGSQASAKAVLDKLNGHIIGDKRLGVEHYQIGSSVELLRTAGLFIRGLPPVWLLAEADMFFREIGAPIPTLINRYRALPSGGDDAETIEYFCSWATDHQIDDVFDLLQGREVSGHELIVTKFMPKSKMLDSSRSDESALDDPEVGRRPEWLERFAGPSEDPGLTSFKLESVASKSQPSYGSLLTHERQQADNSTEHHNEASETGLDQSIPLNLAIDRSADSLSQSIMDVNYTVAQLSTTIAPVPDVTSREPSVQPRHEHVAVTQSVDSARDPTSDAYRPIVVPNNENYIMDSLKNLTEVTQQLLKALTMKQQQQDSLQDIHADPTWPNPPRVRRPPTFEDKLRDQVGTTTLEKLGNPNPEGQFAQLVEGLVNMNESGQDQRRTAREKLRGWNRYSSLDNQKAETSADHAEKLNSSEEFTGGARDSSVEAALDASRVRKSTTIGKSSRALPDQKQGIDLFNQLFGEQTNSSLNPAKALPRPHNGTYSENLIVPTIRYDQSPASSKPGKTIKDTKGKLLAQETYNQDSAAPLAALAGLDSGETTVLLLRGVSSNLAEDDIRRVVPKGKHLADWFGNNNLLHVFPRRDRWTLKHQGAYWLVFRTRAAADEYKKTVKRLQALAAQYTPTSIISPILPAHDQKHMNESDVHAAVKSFTLAVPGQPIELSEHQDKHESWYKNLFIRGGYPQIMTASGVRRPQVMLSFEHGFIPSQADVEASIHYDGERRMVEWRVDWPDDNHQQSSVAPFPTTQTAVDPAELESIEQRSPIRRIHGRSPTFSYDKDGNFIPKSRHTSRSNTSPNEDEAEGFGANSYIDKDMRSRWLIAFKDEIEAKRFALAWHRRPLPMRPDWIEEKGLRMEGSIPTCVTEWLW